MTTALLTTRALLYETPDAIAKEESLQGGAPLTPDLLRRMNVYWRAANYVLVGQVCLYENPLLKEPLKLEDSPSFRGISGCTRTTNSSS